MSSRRGEPLRAALRADAPPVRPPFQNAIWALLAPVAVALAAACGENLTYPTDRDPYDPGDGAPLACVPNLDGQIAAGELEAALGVPVSYLVSPAGVLRTVDVAGTVDAQGHLVWDFSDDYADDQIAELAAAPLAGRWYAGDFPGGQFVTPLDAAGALEAVYARDEGSLRLLGIASAAADPPEGRTRLVYAEPVVLYPFPLAPGDQWVSVGDVTGGTIRGLPYAGRDTYELAVDGAGRLELPDLGFEQALRVRSRVTVQPAVGAATSRRQVSFLFECFGEVARATSRDGETEADFTTAAEVRRLGL